MADDHPVVLQGLVTVLSKSDGITVVCATSNGIEAVRLYRGHRPDVALLDLRMPGLGGIEALAEIRLFDPEARVIVLTGFNESEDVRRAIQAGARGYLLKNVSWADITAAVRRVASGQTYFHPEVVETIAGSIGHTALTPRELEVLRLIAGGEKNRQIALRLGLSEGTVKSYVSAVMAKLGARDRTEAVVIALHRGVIHVR